jgi:hypothetical protein
MSIVAAIVASLVTIAIVSLRGGHHATDERKRQSRSSKEAFHFDLPTDRTSRLGGHYRTSRLIED